MVQQERVRWQLLKTATALICSDIQLKIGGFEYHGSQREIQYFEKIEGGL